MIKNPFTSETFTSIWSKHFNHAKKGISFDFIDNVSFVKHSQLPYYINVGKNLTSGIEFTLSSEQETDYKGKVFLIRDIPSYLNIDEHIQESSSLTLKKIFQYEGYITKVSEYDSLEDYLKSIYKSNTRSKFRRNITRLEACFYVKYTMYYGEISKEDFSLVFDKFYKLFEKRYADKNEPCGELEPTLWSYYTELVYEMINKKQASLFVIYCDNIPVGITFSYHSDTTLVEALTVFDIDFYRYNIGHTTIQKMLEWSFDNGIQTFDYTQGDFDYKKRWSSDTYQTHYYMFYDSSSIKSRCIAFGITAYFDLKRYLRDKNVNSAYHKLKHRLFKSNKPQEIFVETYVVSVLEDGIPNKSDLTAVDLYAENFMPQRRALYDFLYMNPEPVKTLQIFTSENEANTYYAYGQNNILKITKDVA